MYEGNYIEFPTKEGQVRPDWSLCAPASTVALSFAMRELSRALQNEYHGPPLFLTYTAPHRIEAESRPTGYECLHHSDAFGGTSSDLRHG